MGPTPAFAGKARKCLQSTIIEKFQKSYLVSQHAKVPHWSASVLTHTMGWINVMSYRCVQLQGYDFTGIREMWWDGSCGWTVAMEGYRLFRKDRLGRRGRRVALYMTEQLECMEFCLEMDDEAEGSGQCHFKAALYNFWLTVVTGKITWRLQEKKKMSLLSSRRRAQGTTGHSDSTCSIGRWWSS